VQLLTSLTATKLECFKFSKWLMISKHGHTIRQYCASHNRMAAHAVHTKQDFTMSQPSYLLKLPSHLSVIIH